MLCSPAFSLRLKAEGGGAAAGFGGVSHKAEVHLLVRGREVGEGQFALEGSGFDDDRQGLSAGAHQGGFGERKDEGAVRVEIVVDDPVGVERRLSIDLFHLDVALGRTAQPSQQSRVLVEASRLERHLSQIAGAGVSRVSGRDRGLQGDRALSRRPHVLEGDVGAVLPVLAQPAQIDRFLEPFIFLKSAGPR